MKPMKKVIAFLLVALLLLPGCVSQYANTVNKADPTAAPAQQAETKTETKTEAKTEAKPAEAAPTEAPAREKQTLQVWYAVSGTSGDKFVAMSKAFDEGNDLVDLELSYSGGSADTATKVSAALLTNTQPDVALMYAGPLYTGGRNAPACWTTAPTWARASARCPSASPPRSCTTTRPSSKRPGWT